MPRLLRHAALTALALLATLPAAAQASIPGVNVGGAPTDQTITDAIATGAKHVRMFVVWRDFEPDGPGDYPAPSGDDAKVNNLNNLRAAYDTAVDRLNAAGAKPIFVVVDAPAWAAAGSGDHPIPANPAQYAEFFGEFVGRYAGKAAAFEVWNEPDAPKFWGGLAPDVAAYTRLLQASYDAAKKADPTATILAGPTTGNNYAWIEGIYANGGGNAFDGVAVHTDTACLDRGPDRFYREPTGRLGQYTFLGYREVKASMNAHGQDKPIWMTELGWSSTNGGPTSCERGDNAGKKPSGVSEADQAAFLQKAFECLALDPYVVAAAWFNLRDDPNQKIDEERHYGLLRANGSKKPVYDVFARITAANGKLAPTGCGDFSPPQITIGSPVPGQQFVDRLDISASAVDGGDGATPAGLGRITFAFDGGQEIRNFTDALQDGKPVGLAPWFGSRNLPLGKHTIEVVALDMNGNRSESTVEVEKVAPGAIKSTLTPKFKIARKVKCKRTLCTISGSLLRGAAGRPSIGGKVNVEWLFKNKKGKFRKLYGGAKPANKAFKFERKLRKGSWKVRITYTGLAPWKKTSSKTISFKVR